MIVRWSSLPVILLVPLLLSAACGNDDVRQVYPEIFYSADELDFGTLPVLHVSTVEPVIGNRGLAQLRISEVEIVGDDASYFWFEQWPEEIEVGSESSLPLFFQPEEERSYEALLRIHSDDPERPIVESVLSGEGLTVSAIELEPESIYFGLVGEGVIAIESFRIRSVGTAPLVVETIEIEEGSSLAYKRVGSWEGPLTIESGQSIELTVAFMPEVGEEETEGTILVTSTDPARRVASLSMDASINRAPVAVCGDEETLIGAPGDVVTLDGTQSYDPDGHEPLSYEWEVVRRPLTSLTELEDAFTPTPSIELDVAGTWEAQLTVTDSLGTESVAPCRSVIRAVAAERLYIELVWDHPITDLDLHVLTSGAELFGDGDCWWGNPDAFGCEHSGDDLAGYGPEWVRMDEPDPGSYEIKVRYAKTNGASEPATRATVRVYLYGVLEAEMSRTLEQERHVWDVLTVDWPSGHVTPVDSVQVSQ